MSGQDTNPELQGLYEVFGRMKAPPLIDCTKCIFFSWGLSEQSTPFFEIYDDLNKEAFIGECRYSGLPVQKGMRCDELTQLD